MTKIFKGLLAGRGVDARFLVPKYEDLMNPFLLPDMKEAVERIFLAGKRGEKVVIYGDYDVDGVCASAVMRQALVWAGVEDIEILLPDRFGEGYGLNGGAVVEIEKLEAKLVVTVDCGSRSVDVVKKLRKKGVDVVVTDHHEVGDELPDCLVVNPKRGEVGKDLSGTGVSFMVARAVRGDGQEKWLLDLVCVATLCDSMLLSGENRILTYYGMKVLKKTRRVGLVELMKISGTKELGSHAVGFQIGPRLNAGGRMESAHKALSLLLTESKMEAAGLAVELDRLNGERRKAQIAAVAEVEEMVGDDPVIVVSGDWHEGVIGIIAGRLVEKYRRPAFVFTGVHDGTLKGSARSFGEFDLAQALLECQDCLLRGGGHNYAAGMTTVNENFEELKTRLNKYYKSLELKNQERFLVVREDVVVEDLGELTIELCEELMRLEPYGEGNLEPVFLLRGMEVVESMKMGKTGEHLRLKVKDKKGNSIKCVGFFAKEEWFIERDVRVDVWVNLTANEWKGVKNVEGRILCLEGMDEV